MNNYAAKPAQADLRFLVNLHSRHSVALINLGEPLLTAIQSEDIKPDTLSSTLLIKKNNTYDVIFSASDPNVEPSLQLQFFANALKPHGQALYCFRNKLSPKNLGAIFKKKKRGQHTLISVKNAVKAAGLKITHVYGVYGSLDEPRYFIPLENPYASGFFFKHMLTPYTRSIKILSVIAPLLVSLRWHSILFSDICLVLES